LIHFVAVVFSIVVYSVFIMWISIQEHKT